MRLLRDVYLLAGPMYGVHQNVYGLAGNGALVLVDTGKNGRDLDVVRRNIDYWGLKALPIRHVLLTHEHFEHCANALALQGEGAHICASREAAAALAMGDERVAHYAYAFEPPFEPLELDMPLDDDQRFTAAGMEFRCLHVPGHSAGSAVYLLELDGRKVLFSGDVVIPGMLCFQANTGWTGAIDYDRELLIESVGRLSGLDVDVLLPGHGEICLRQGNQLLKEAYVRARLSLRHAAVSEPLKGGAAPCK